VGFEGITYSSNGSQMISGTRTESVFQALQESVAATEISAKVGVHLIVPLNLRFEGVTADLVTATNGNNDLKFKYFILCLAGFRLWRGCYADAVLGAVPRDQITLSRILSRKT
jgi:hypothetical protein